MILDNEQLDNVLNLKELINNINDMDEITLENTVSLMTHPDYKVRFIAEYMQAKIRYNSLHKMIIKYEAGTLDFTPTCDISVLEDQAYHLGCYLKTLEIRSEVEKIELPKI